MDETFAASFQRVRRRVLLFNLGVLSAGLAGLADIYHLSTASRPNDIAVYGFACLFAIVFGTYPVMSYVLTRCIRRWNVGTCPQCHQPIWDNTIVATETAISQRCPRCGESLQWRQGFRVMPAPEDAARRGRSEMRSASTDRRPWRVRNEMTQENPLEDVGPPLSRQKIAELEAQLGVALPDDYRQFLLESNGGRPKRGFFQFHYGPAPEWMAEKWRAKWEEHQERWIDDFFVIDDNLARPDRSDPHTLAFWRAADWLMLPPDVLPVAAVTRDDVLLIYIRGPRRGEVHLLCSDYLDAKEEATEQDVQGAIRFVARTFGEFLDGLYEAD